MKKNKLNVYVIMHKYVELDKYKLDKCYKKLLVGKKSCEQKDITLDSTGDNISKKNKSYCELTGLYWIWKNSTQDFVGMVHYRRFFVNNNTLSILKEEDILKILKEYDIILPYKNRIKNTKITLFEDYGIGHYQTDLEKCKIIISKIYPEYMDSFENVMEGKYYYPFNMFVMSMENTKKYCEWLFNIFDELEKIVDISQRNDYQKRLFGFLSERLFLVWIRKNNLRIHENFVIKTDDGLYKKVKFLIKVILKKLHIR